MQAHLRCVVLKQHHRSDATRHRRGHELVHALRDRGVPVVRRLDVRARVEVRAARGGAEGFQRVELSERVIADLAAVRPDITGAEDRERRLGSRRVQRRHRRRHREHSQPDLHSHPGRELATQKMSWKLTFTLLQHRTRATRGRLGRRFAPAPACS
jgi:hypothetical protein